MREVLQRLLHRVEAFAGGMEYSRELAKAKQSFFNPVGAPGEKGENAEVELSNFIEWFVFDHKMENSGNVWSEFMRYKGAECTSEELEVLKQLNHQNYSLFLVKKADQEKALVRDLVSNQKYKPVQGLSRGLQKGDYFLGRIIIIDKKFYFSEATFFLPRSISEIFLERAKLVRKNRLDKDAFIEELRGLAMKSYRYPRMKLEELYK
jgi:hypothetical protein